MLRKTPGSSTGSAQVKTRETSPSHRPSPSSPGKPQRGKTQRPEVKPARQTDLKIRGRPKGPNAEAPNPARRKQPGTPPAYPIKIHNVKQQEQQTERQFRPGARSEEHTSEHQSL